MKRNKKNLQYRLNTSVLICGAIVVVVLLNAILMALGTKMPLSIDFTANEIFVLSDQTKEVAKKLNKEIEILMVTDGTDREVYSIIKGVVEKYTQINSKITFNEINFTQNPIALKEYMIEEPDMQLGTLILKSADAHEIANSADFFTADNQSNIERLVTAKLTNFINEHTISEITFMTGHGERELAAASTLFEMEGYEVVTFDSLTDDFPQGQNSLVIISAPQNDFTAEEIDKLDKYLDDGGNVQIFFDPYYLNGPLPRLEAYLKDDWGIIKDEYVVFDKQGIEGSQFILAEFGEHEAAQAVADSGKHVVYVPASRITLSENLPERVSAESLLVTSDDAYSMNITSMNTDEFTQENSERGKFSIMVAAQRVSRDIDDNEKTGKMVVCGTSEAFDSVVTDTRFANEEIFLSVINWMKGNEDGVTIKAKKMPSGEIMLTKNALWTWLVILVIVVPLLLLAASVFVYIKRKHK